MFDKVAYMSRPVVFDIETRKSFREVNNNVKKLGISVVGAYDYATDKMHIFAQDNLNQLFSLFERASIIIGYNINSFDLAVLNEFYVGNIYSLPHFDMLEDVRKKMGKRLPLEDFVQATLGEGKSGHGLHAIELFRSGKIDELSKYCSDDVRLTKDLFQFGVKNGYIYYPEIPEKRMLRVEWEKIVNSSVSTNHNLTLGL